MVHSALLDIFRLVKLTSSGETRESLSACACVPRATAQMSTQSGRLDPSGRFVDCGSRQRPGVDKRYAAQASTMPAHVLPMIPRLIGLIIRIFCNVELGVAQLLLKHSIDRYRPLELNASISSTLNSARIALAPVAVVAPHIPPLAPGKA
jgi:hypothetical protein